MCGINFGELNLKLKPLITFSKYLLSFYLSNMHHITNILQNHFYQLIKKTNYSLDYSFNKLLFHIGMEW